MLNLVFKNISNEFCLGLRYTQIETRTLTIVF